MATSPRDGRAAALASVGFGVVLLLVLHLRLLGALLAGLSSFAVYRALLSIGGPNRHRHERAVAALVMTVIFFVVVGFAATQLAQAFWTPHGGFTGLLQLLADAIDRARSSLPEWASSRLPDSAGGLEDAATQWLRSHAQSLQHWGREALRETAHVLVGLVAGLLAAFEPWPPSSAAWARGARRSLAHLQFAFTRIVSAQLRIAFANTVFTGLYLLVALPLAGIHMPAGTTLVIFTFVAGLVPIVGNLMSNAAIVLVSLTVSPGVALASTLFLIGIHKLEYFLNAHFVGRSTRVPASLILASMLVLEAAFGVAGLVAAPIYCAWVLRELEDRPPP